MMDAECWFTLKCSLMSIKRIKSKESPLRRRVKRIWAIFVIFVIFVIFLQTFFKLFTNFFQTFYKLFDTLIFVLFTLAFRRVSIVPSSFLLFLLNIYICVFYLLCSKVAPIIQTYPSVTISKSYFPDFNYTINLD